VIDVSQILPCRTAVINIERHFDKSPAVDVIFNVLKLPRLIHTNRQRSIKFGNNADDKRLLEEIYEDTEKQTLLPDMSSATTRSSRDCDSVSRVTRLNLA